MGDQESGAAQLAQGVEHRRLASWVEGTGGLIQQKKLGLADQGAGNRQFLALAAGQLPPFAGERGLQPHRQGFEVVAEADGVEGLHRRGHCQGAASGQHVPDRVTDETTVLEHGADLRSQQVLLQQAGIGAVEPEHAVLRVAKTQQQMQQGRLAASGGSHQCHIAAGGDVDAQILQGPGAALVVAEADSLKVNGSLELTGVLGTRLPFRRAGEQALASTPFAVQLDQRLQLVAEQLAAGQLQSDQWQDLQWGAGVQSQPKRRACKEQG